VTSIFVANYPFAPGGISADFAEIVLLRGFSHAEYVFLGAQRGFLH